MPEALSSAGDGWEPILAARTSTARILRSRIFWEPRALHPVVRLLLVLAVAVLLCIAVGFVLASGEFTRNDLLAVALYLSLATFVWHATTAAFIVMVISSVGVVFTGSAGDILEFAIALGLVAATCAPWVIAAHVMLLGSLTTYIAVSGSALAEGGVYGIAGIAVIALLAGLAFRLVAARETVLIAERARVAKSLEVIAQQNQERIADELHDGIAHDLTLILFHARALPRQPDDAARQISLNTIEESAEQALESIQSLLSLMRDTTTEGPQTPGARYEVNLAKAASSLGALLKDAGIPTNVATPDVPLSIASAAERALTATAIEAVTNIIKHAPKAAWARIEIHDRSDAVELMVTNAASAGLVRHNRATGGRGLKRAKQRLAHANGELDYGWSANGWTLRATIPTEISEEP